MKKDRWIEKIEETTGQKYNGVPITVGGHKRDTVLYLSECCRRIGAYVSPTRGYESGAVLCAHAPSVGRGGVRAADGARDGHHEAKHRLLRRPDDQDLRLNGRGRLDLTGHYTPQHAGGSLHTPSTLGGPSPAFTVRFPTS